MRSGHFDGGGVSRVIESWARMLIAAGQQVTVISRADSRARPLGVAGARELFSPPRAQARRQNALLAEGQNVATLVGDLRARNEVDVVLVHNSLLATHIGRALPGLPIVLTVHSPAVEEHSLTNWKYARSTRQRIRYPITRAALGRFDRRALSSATVVHTLSRYTWDLLSARFPQECRQAVWVKVPGTFDHDRFCRSTNRLEVRRSLGIRDDEKILLTVRRLVPRNGIDRILTAAKSPGARGRRARFLIGGSGDLGSALRNRIRKEDLHNVELLGFIPDAQLASYYQAADVFLMPTRELECFGLPVIEAMGSGCPVLVMPEGGPAEICQEFPEWIAHDNTDEAFTELVSRYLEGRVNHPSDHIDRWARDHYSEDAQRAHVLDVVERAVRT